MNRVITLFFLILFSCVTANAQEAYKKELDKLVKEGNSFVASGKYAEASVKFEGARAVLLAKRINKNSQEFIDIEKKINYAEQCRKLSSTADGYWNKLQTSQLQAAFESCDSEMAADAKYQSLLADLDKLKKCLNDILQKFSIDKVAKEKLKACDAIRVKIDGFHNNYPETLAWRNAARYDTRSAYSDFLASFPDGGYASAAQSRIAEIDDSDAWSRASYQNSFLGYKEYLEAYPMGLYAEEAQAKLMELGEYAEWEMVRDNPNSKDVQSYITKYPNSRYLEEAYQLLFACKDDEAWEVASNANSRTAFNKYISQFPQGRHVAAAKNGIDKIAEENEWQEAVKTNTIDGYRKYLNSSKTKAYKKEADQRIADIQHKIDVDEDNARWARIKASEDPGVFSSYLARSGYKGYEKPAAARMNYLKARQSELTAGTAATILDYYDKSRFNDAVQWTDADKQRYEEAKELKAYNSFLMAKSEKSAQQYLSAYPQGQHANELSDYLARYWADKMTISSYETDYVRAKSYSRSKEVNDYVDTRYREQKRAYKKSLREPFHFAVGGQALVYMADGEFEDYDYGFMLSLGDHRNRINFEVAYNVNYSDLIFRPRLNIIKQESLSSLYLYVEPELHVYEFYFPEPDYGVRVGLGLSLFDLSVGYSVNEELFSFSVGFYL